LSDVLAHRYAEEDDETRCLVILKNGKEGDEAEARRLRKEGEDLLGQHVNRLINHKSMAGEERLKFHGDDKRLDKKLDRLVYILWR
jgi:hypothetical protein